MLHPEAGVARTRGPCSGLRDGCMSPGVSKGIACCGRGGRASGVLAEGLVALVRSRPWEHFGFSSESREPVWEDETGDGAPQGLGGHSWWWKPRREARGLVGASRTLELWPGRGGLRLLSSLGC